MPQYDRKFLDDDLIRAFVASELMQETAIYLKRGRAFSEMPREELDRRWLVAFREWFETRTEQHQQVMDDLAAELRLRGETPPYHLIGAEAEALRDEIRDSDPEDFTIEEDFGRFIDKLDTPDS